MKISLRLWVVQKKDGRGKRGEGEKMVSGEVITTAFWVVQLFDILCSFIHGAKTP